MSLAPETYRMITVKLPLLFSTDGQFSRHELVLNDFSDISVALLNDFKLKSDAFYLLKCSETSYQVKLRLRGGKGGFGSQLRAQGNKMSSKKRAGNYESCRGLNGQRLRVQKHTKMIEEYLAKEPERLSKREQEIREKMQKYLEAPDKKVMFSDPDYLKLCRKLIDSTEDAVRSGLRAKSNEESESDLESESESEELSDQNERDDIANINLSESSLNDMEEDEKAPLNSTVKLYNNNSRITSKYLDKYL